MGVFTASPSIERAGGGTHAGTVTVRVRSIAWFVAGSIIAAAVMMMFIATAWQADAAPGDDDSTFVPITPCRLADTRPEPTRVGLIGTLSADSTVPFTVHGTNGQCNIPTEAVAVAMNVTAVGASAPTYLTFWPDGDQPTAASLNPAPGQPPTPNAVTVQLSGSGSFNVYNSAGTVNVVVDVNGYYVASSLEDLDARLAAVEDAAAANAGAIATNSTGVAANAAAAANMPFAGFGSTASIALLSTTEPAAEVSVVAPADGQVTVIGHALADLEIGGAGKEIRCVVGPKAALPSDVNKYDPGVMLFETETGGSEGSLSGFGVFDISAGDTVTYAVGCLSTAAGGSLTNSRITALFTPAP